MADINVNSQPVLSVENLTTSFKTPEGWRAVIRNINLHVDAGETVAIVGESGSGKSVTALSTMRLLPPGRARCDGRILLDGKDLLQASEADMRAVRGGSIGIIFQEPMTSLNPVFTIGNQVAEALVLHRGLSWKAAEAETLRLMERVRIPAAKARIHEYPHKFSGGMRQRVMIAMALACRPKLLIADEPTTALDVTIQAEILHLLRELQREENMGILFITHDMGVVAEIADRTVVMFRGDLIETGATAEVFAAPTTIYTRSLLAAIPRLGTMGQTTAPRRFAEVNPLTGEAAEGREMKAVSAATAPILKVENLAVRFDLPNGRVHAVENVSFDLRPGETLSLVGRIRVRQVDDRSRDHPAAQSSRRLHRHRRAGRYQSRCQGPQGHAPEFADDLPGSVRVAQSAYRHWLCYSRANACAWIASPQGCQGARGGVA